jgi:3-hydroxybutyryl-CoA dehydrogenase
MEVSPMPYTLPDDVDERPVVVDGAGTLGRRLAAVYLAGGSDVRVFDPSEDAREAARAYVDQHADEVKQALGLTPERSGTLELAGDLEAALDRAWMVIEAVPEKVELKRSPPSCSVGTSMKAGWARRADVGSTTIRLDGRA